MLGNLQTWSPVRELEHFRRDLDQLMANFFGSRTHNGESNETMMPPVESFIENDKMVILADLPGVEPRDVEISVIGRILTIKGSRTVRRDENRKNYLLHEVEYGRFERDVALPEEVKVEEIKASYKGGVLELTVPLSKKLASQKVKIQLEGGDAKTQEGKRA